MLAELSFKFRWKSLLKNGITLCESDLFSLVFVVFGMVRLCLAERVSQRHQTSINITRHLQVLISQLFLTSSCCTRRSNPFVVLSHRAGSPVTHVGRKKLLNPPKLTSKAFFSSFFWPKARILSVRYNCLFIIIVIICTAAAFLL